MIRRSALRRSRKAWVPKLGYSCKHCGGNDHHSFSCFQKPKRPLAKESPEAKRKRLSLRKRWMASNPPDEDGTWPCYLGISPDCVRRVTAKTINLEHVRSKTRHPKLKFQEKNIKSACQPCNKLKASWELEQLAETYEVIVALLQDAEFATYLNELDNLERSMR